MSFDAGSIIGTADLDRSPFNVGLDLAKADAEAFEAHTYKASLAADRTSADNTVDAEVAKLDDYGAKTVTAKAEVATGDSGEKLAVENAALDAFGRRRDTATVAIDSSGADRTLDDLKTKAADAAGSGGLGFLLTTALSLGPALVPIGSVAVAGLAAIAPMALAAGAGIGAFALAAAGDLGNVEKAAQSTLKNFQDLAAPAVFPVLAQSIGLLVPAFSFLVPLVDSTATELGHLEDAASTALQAPFWRGFVTFLAAEAGPAIGAFATLVGGVGKAFAGVSMAFAPVIADIEGGMDGFAARLAAWGQGLDTSNGFISFLNYVHTEAPVVGQLLTTLGGSLEHIVVGLAPIGAVVLTAATDLSHLVDALTAVNPLLTTVGLTVAGSLYAWSKLSPLIDGVQAAMLRFSTTAQGVEGVIGGSEGGIATYIAGIGGLGSAFAIALPVIAAAGAAIYLSGRESKDAAAAAQEFLGGVATETATTLPQLTAKIGDLTAKIAELKKGQQDGTIGFGEFADAGQALQTSLDQTKQSVANYHANLQTLEGDTGLTASGVEALAKSININLGSALSPSQVRQFTAAIQQQGAQAGLTADAIKGMADSDGAAFQKMVDAGNAAATATKTSWAQLGNAVTAFASSTLPPTAAAIGAFYATSELQGAQFSQNISAAIKAGYSPTLISSIIQAGPAQASQLLQGLVNAQGSGLQTLISQATSAMTKEGQEAVEQARLTARAVAAPTSEIAAALPTALAVSEALTQSNAAAQVAAVARTLSGGLPQLVSIAQEYGITLPAGLTSQVQAVLEGASAQSQAVSAGMRANQSDTDAAARAAAMALPTAVQSAYGPAAIAGQGLMGQVAGGITIAQSLVTSAASSGALVAGSAFANGANWGSIGHNIDAGIAGGIAGGTGLLQAAIAGLAGQTLLAGQHAINANSPSRLFRDQIGLPIAEGIAIGILSGAGTVSAAVGLVAAQAVAGGRAAISTVGALGGVPGQIGGFPIVPGVSIALPAGTNPGGPERTPGGGFSINDIYNPGGPEQVAGQLSQRFGSATLYSPKSVTINVAGSADAKTVDAMRQMLDSAFDEHDNSMLAELDALGVTG